MSVPKSFEQVLRAWRGRATNSECEHCQVLIACADEAQPILDKLREEVDGMANGVCGDCEVLREYIGNLQRTLGERE